MRALAYEDDKILQARELRLLLLLLLSLTLALFRRRLVRTLRRGRGCVWPRLAPFGDGLRVVREFDNTSGLHRDMVDHLVRHWLVHERKQLAVVERPRQEGRRMAGVRYGHDEMRSGEVEMGRGGMGRDECECVGLYVRS